MSPSAPAQLQIKVNGAALPPAAAADLTELSVNQRLGLSDQFTLSLRTWDRERLAPSWVDDATFALGNTLELSVVHEGRVMPLVAGEIVDLELSMSMNEPPRLTVWGLDARHALARGQKTRAFLNKTYADIVGEIARANGLTAAVSGDGLPHEAVEQSGQSDLAFLNALAEESGRDLWLVGTTLHFEPPDTSGQPAVTLSTTRSLLAFSPRVSTAQLVAEVEVRGSDPIEAKQVVGRAEASSLAASLGTVPGDKLRGSGQRLVGDHPIEKPEHADALARVEMERIFSACVTGSGRCFGDPAIRPGTVIRVEDIGARFSGRYYVTAATHSLSSTGYRTHFEVQAWSSTLVTAPRRLDGDAPGAGRIHGVALARVSNTSDPKGLGRVKLRFPWLPDDYESGWARVVAPAAGANRGLFSPPEVNDEVAVLFDHGDLGSPYVIGALWNGEAKPPADNSNGENNLRVFKSRSGHTLTFDDTKDAERIVLTDKTGNNQLVIDSQEGTLTLSADQDVKIVAGGNLSLEASGDLSLKARGALALEAQGDLSVKGNNVSARAQASGAFEANAGLGLKCMAGVKINDGALEVT